MTLPGGTQVWTQTRNGQIYQWRVESDAARVQSTNWSFGARQAWWVATSEVHPMTVVSDKQAYAARFHFLEQLYLRTKSDDLGGLLGGM
jgi:hypothetical protein